MVDKLTPENIQRANYSFYSSRYFFGFGDENYTFGPVRIVKLLYAIISFILNLLIVISLLKRKKKKFSIALILTGNILLMNFIHTFSYTFEWVLKEDDVNKDRGLYILKNGTILNRTATNDIKENYYLIGGLLIGNPNNMGICQFQGFLLVFSALSQDFLINIFFYIINLPKIPSQNIIRVFLLLLGYCTPLIISFIFLLIKGLGINDKFCYIKKFDFTINEKNIVTYKVKDNFIVLVYSIYIIRFLNLLLSLVLLIKIIRYVKLNKLKNMYILKLSTILIVQVVTIFIGLIYRFGGSIYEGFSRNFSTIFLCINTIDGILFPLSYSLSNGVYKNLFCGISSKDSLEYISGDEDEMLSCGSTNSLIGHSPTVEKTFAMVDVKDDNNFDLSYQ